MSRLLKTTLAFVLLSAAFHVALKAERSIVISSFECEVLVHEDGTIDVEERIWPRFIGSWNGIIRLIPIQYRDRLGLNYTLRLDLRSITDGAGNPYKYEAGREGHHRRYKIWVPDARDATRAVVIRYRVHNGLKFFDTHDELYWNITGDEWEMPIERASARIFLPASLEGIRTTAFTGGYGASEQAASIDQAGNLVTVRTTRPLNFREGLTVAVAWNPGVIRRPTTLDRAAGFLRSNWLLVLPLLTFVGMYKLWHFRGRDPRLNPIVVLYEPPEGMCPAEMGTLVDNSPDLRDITATLVDLAVRGYLLIEEREKDQLFGLWSKKTYQFEMRNADWSDLKRHERRLLEALFKGGSRPCVELTELQNQFYKELPGIRDRIFDALIGKGYYERRPDKVRQAFLIAGVILGVGVGWGGVVVSQQYGWSETTAVVSAILTGLIVLGFGWFMPARTVAGARAFEQALGFEEFLERVESDRFSRVIKTPEMFEKYLPYALALGVEKNWAQAFEGIYKGRPEWFRGGDFATFRTTSLASNLNRMSSQTGAAMSSAPRGSSGSGFSGGSSGGGFGGGGGRGF
jgi:uncharacterized membrane protein